LCSTKLRRFLPSISSLAWRRCAPRAGARIETTAPELRHGAAHQKNKIIRVVVSVYLGGLSAWLTRDEKRAEAILWFIGPIIGAVLVIAIFVLLAAGILLYLAGLSR
jgi:hypothetical protein